MANGVGLALGSGGARGWAHIGVIRALEDANIPITHVAGASIGAFVGAIYAAGELNALEEYVVSLDWRMILSFFDLVFPKQGLLDGNRVYELLTEHLLDLRIEAIEMPFCCVATDLSKNREVRLQSGRLADAVRASISIPGVFTPFAHQGCYLADGGIVNPVPVDVARELGAEFVIAVNLNHAHPDLAAVADEPSAASYIKRRRQQPEAPADGSESLGDTDPAESENTATEPPSWLTAIKEKYASVTGTIGDKVETWLSTESADTSQPNIFDVIGTTLNIMEQRITVANLEVHQPDLLLQPRLSSYGIFDFDQAEDLIEIGYTAMTPHIEAIKDKLGL